MDTNFRKSQIKEKLKVKVSDSWSFSKLNYLIFTFGLISIFIGYIILIPISLIIKRKEK